MKGLWKQRGPCWEVLPWSQVMVARHGYPCPLLDFGSQSQARGTLPENHRELLPSPGRPRVARTLSAPCPRAPPGLCRRVGEGDWTMRGLANGPGAETGRKGLPGPGRRLLVPARLRH